MISLWEPLSDHVVHSRLTALLTTLALGMIQVVNEGTTRALIPWAGRPPGPAGSVRKRSSLFAGLTKMVAQKLEPPAAISASTQEELA